MSLKLKKRGWLMLVGGLVLVTGTGAMLMKGSSAGIKGTDGALTAKVQRQNLTIEVIEVGKIEPLEKVDIKSKVPGQAEQVLVDEGAHVEKDQLLLRLDPTDFRREVAQANAEVQRANYALEYAQLTLKRRQQAFKDRGVSQADVDFALNDVKSKTAMVKLAQVALAAAQDRLRYTEIVSPIKGTVIARGIEPGEVVTPGVQATFEGKALLTIANLETLVIKTNLNQIDVAKVQLGQNVTLTLDGLADKVYHAKVTKIASAATTVKGKEVELFPVEATLVDPDAQIKPGMTADVRIHVETKKQVLVLPIEAVTKHEGTSRVTRIVTDGKGNKRQEKVEVTTGSRNDRDIEIQSGVSEGDMVSIESSSSVGNEVKM